MKLFRMFRRDVARFGSHDENQMNPEDEPQFEGVIFSDGHVAIRWLTAKRSTAVWDSMEDMLAIHGHPEYGSQLVWEDPDSKLLQLLVPCCGHELSKHTSNGLAVECECGCRAMFLFNQWSPYVLTEA